MTTMNTLRVKMCTSCTHHKLPLTELLICTLSLGMAEPPFFQRPVGVSSNCVCRRRILDVCMLTRSRPGLRTPGQKEDLSLSHSPNQKVGTAYSSDPLR